MKKFLILFIIFLLQNSFLKAEEIDFASYEMPEKISDFKQVFHLKPIRQWETGTCWCFATISFLESELKRLGKEPVKLSEMYVVYYEFVEKARRFIQEKGKSLFAEGSEHNAAILRIKKYGIVPASCYTGLLEKEEKHNHRLLYKELMSYLNYIKENNYWDEEKALEYVKLILNKHLGKPPVNIKFNDKLITPIEYLNVLSLQLDDYKAFISTKSFDFYKKGEFKVPDNWWHSKEYHNVPLDVFYEIIVKSLKNNYSVAIAGDVSEPGLSGKNDIAVIPNFDIPKNYINQDSREYRFFSRVTTDDHAMHIVGYLQKNNADWFLLKDSSRRAYEGKHKGYLFFNEDFVKLKMLALLIHKDMVKDILEKFSCNKK